MSFAHLAHLLVEPEWMERAACRDMDSSLFFPSRNGPSDKRAKQICAGCVVQTECIDEALSRSGHYDFGIWGGTNAQQRRKLRRAA